MISILIQISAIIYSRKIFFLLSPFLYFIHSLWMSEEEEEWFTRVQSPKCLLKKPSIVPVCATLYEIPTTYLCLIWKFKWKCIKMTDHRRYHLIQSTETFWVCFFFHSIEFPLNYEEKKKHNVDSIFEMDRTVVDSEGEWNVYINIIGRCISFGLQCRHITWAENV